MQKGHKHYANDDGKQNALGSVENKRQKQKSCRRIQYLKYGSPEWSQSAKLSSPVRLIRTGD